jgi:hypothetical protein
VSQQINLFNPALLKQKKIFTAVPMAEALGVVLIGALALTWYANRRVAELEQIAASGKTMLAGREVRLTQAVAQFAPRQKSAALAAEVAQAKVELQALHEVASVLRGGALGNTTGYAEYFRALARQNVNGLWLTGVTIVGAGNDIGVQGRAMQPTLIPNYIARLTGERIMHGKTFASLDISRPELAAVAATAPAPLPIAPQLAALAGLSTSKTKAGAASKSTAAAVPQAVVPVVPAVPAASIASGPTAAPYVEFSLQSTATEAGK